MRYQLLLTCASIAATCSLSGCAAWHAPWSSKQVGQHAAALPPMDRELNLARLAERQGKTEQAQSLYDAVLEVHPDNQIALHRTGVIAAKNGRLEHALEQLRAAVQTQSPSAELLADIGFVHYSLGDFSKAEKTLDEALRLAPNDKRIANNLGLTIGIQGRLEESYRVFQEAGDDAQAHANLAYVRSQLGDVDGAIAGYHEALDRDTELRVAARALVQLDQHSQRAHHKLRPTRSVNEQIAIHAMPQLPAEQLPTEQLPATRPETQLATAQLPAANATLPMVASHAAASAAANHPVVQATGLRATGLQATGLQPASVKTFETVAVPEVETAQQIATIVPQNVQHSVATVAHIADAPSSSFSGISTARNVASPEAAASRDLKLKVEPANEFQLGHSFELGNSATWKMGSE